MRPKTDFTRNIGILDCNIYVYVRVQVHVTCTHVPCTDMFCYIRIVYILISLLCVLSRVCVLALESNDRFVINNLQANLEHLFPTIIESIMSLFKGKEGIL